MTPIFVQFKCKHGMAYRVAEQLLEEIEEISEIYSTSGHYDLLAKFYLAPEQDVGRFVTEKLQMVDGVADTFTLVTFKAFR